MRLVSVGGAAGPSHTFAFPDGYTYEQFSDGTLRIVKSPRGGAGTVITPQSNYKAWEAITAQISNATPPTVLSLPVGSKAKEAKTLSARKERIKKDLQTARGALRDALQEELARVTEALHSLGHRK